MMELKEIVYKLIGKIDPIGETNEDERRFGNLDKFLSLWEDMTYDLLRLSKLRDRSEYSIKRSAIKAEKVIKSNAREILFAEGYVAVQTEEYEKIIKQINAKNAEIERLKNLLDDVDSFLSINEDSQELSELRNKINKELYGD